MANSRKVLARKEGFFFLFGNWQVCVCLLFGAYHNFLGGTLDQTLLKVLGCKERGHKSQGPLVHATGKGWVKEHKGQYYDALHVKNGIVKICLVESQGGIAPPTKASSSTTRNSSRAPPSVATRRTPTTLLATCVSCTH